MENINIFIAISSLVFFLIAMYFTVLKDDTKVQKV